MTRTVRRELVELGLFAALALAVIVVWFGLGWDPSLSHGGVDTLESFTPFTSELVRAGGDWRAVAYRAEVAGGAVLVPILCAFPITRVLAGLGMPAHLVVAGTFFALQAMAGFIGMKTVGDLASLWRERESPDEKHDLGARLLVGIAFAFAPVLGWRIAAGQPGFIAGSFVFSGALMLAASVLAGRVTLAGVGCALVAFMHAFQSMSAQLVVASVIFGGPIVLGAILSEWGRAPRGRLVMACVLPIGIGISGLLISWDVFDAIYRSATSTDFARQYEKSAIYTLVVGRAHDWLASIPWTEPARPTGAAFLRHETNYPFGPALVLLALLPRRKLAAFVLVPLAVSAALVVCVADDIAPIAGALLRVFPVLQSFRVPARAAIPLCLAVLAIGLSAAQSANAVRFTRGVGVAGLFALVAAIVAPTWAFEIGIVGLALAALSSSRFEFLREWSNPAAILVLVAAGSVNAFRQRQPEYASAAVMRNDPGAVHAMVGDAFPEGRRSLRRASIEFATTAGLNTGLAVGISTLNGYANPTARFIALRGAIERKPPDYMRVFNYMSPDVPEFRTWCALYDITHVLRQDKNGIAVFATGQPDRQAWFSAELVRVADDASLANELSRASDLPQALLASGWYVGSDPLAIEPQQMGAPEECARAKVSSVEVLGQRFRVGVESPARCVLTLSTNFTELFRVRIETPSGAQDGRAFPIYGALTGVIVPPGATEVVVEAIVEKRWTGWGMPALGAVLLAALLGLARMLERR